MLHHLAYDFLIGIDHFHIYEKSFKTNFELKIVKLLKAFLKEMHLFGFSGTSSRG